MIEEPPFKPGYKPKYWHELSLSKQYRYACYLYYHGPNTPALQSPLSDAEFDQLQVQLGKDKGDGHTIKITEQEISHVEEIMSRYIWPHETST